MRVGMLGGTFDPIHLGHLRAAESAREVLGLDEVLFVPAHVPPHRSAPVASARDRLTMVGLATADHPAFSACDLELQRDGPSFTVDTLRELEATRPGTSLFLLVGSDTFPELETWKDLAVLRELCRVAVLTRPDRDAATPVSPDIQVEGPALAISATEVRECVRQGRSARYLVPDEVRRYIEDRGLYR